MLWDTHLHTHFSGDSNTLPEAMIEAAIKKNLSGICITDHLDLDYPYDESEFLLDFDRYIPTIAALREQYGDRLCICTGMELGLQPHLAETHRNLLKQYRFDFVIGSSHVVHGIDPWYPEYFEHRSDREGFLEYFDSILENLAVYDDFDVYGHLDYIVRYAPEKNAHFSYSDFSDIIDEILKKLIASGKGIEINTGGFKYGLGHPNPTEDILRRYRELGGEIITIGSDAHAPEHLAYNFKAVPEILKSCGFRYFTVFKNRIPDFIPLD